MITTTRRKLDVSPARPWEPTMPFGRYKRQAFRAIPTDYLVWIFFEVREDRPALAELVFAELERRDFR